MLTPNRQIKDAHCIEAMRTSYPAVVSNPGAMLLWSLVIVALTAVGIATAFVGAAASFHGLGYATWQSYQGEAGPVRSIRGLSAVANLPREIAERQRRQALRRLRDLLPEVEPQVDVEELPAASRGTVLLLLADCAPGRACCFALGARGKRAERVADEAVDALAAFLGSDGAVDPWLADQLLLPLALAKGPSKLRTSEVTAHLLTNAEVIRLFLPVEIGVDGPLGGPATVQVQPGPAGPSDLTRGTGDPCSAGT